MAIILFVNPEDGNIIFANNAAAKYYGYGNEQLLSINIDSINTLPPREIMAIMMDARKKKSKLLYFQT